jgi:Na+/phosphate symporter
MNWEAEMKTGKLLAAGALAFALSAGLAQAKIPVLPMDDAAKAKAEEAKAKTADAAKIEAEQLAKAQDRVVERYKKGEVKAAPAKPAKK